MRSYHLWISLLCIPALALAAESPKPAEGKKLKALKTKQVATAPKAGVRTPGVQIAYTELKAENEFPFAPDWILASDKLLAPNKIKDSIERIDPKTFQQGDAISGIAKPCGGAVSAFKDIWTVSCADAALIRMEAKTGKVIAKIATGASSMPGVLAADSDSVWMLTDNKTTLSRVDPGDNKIIAEVRLPAGCESITFGEGALWAACPDASWLLRINTLTNLIEQRIEVSAGPEAVAVGEGSVWVLCKKEGKLERVDPKTNKVAKTIALEVPDAVGNVTTGAGSVWVSLAGFPLTRIDPEKDKERVAQQFWGEGGGAVYFASNSLWISDAKAATLKRIDPKRVLATLPE